MSKLGNFDGSVPPTSQFTFDQKICTQIANSTVLHTLPNFIQSLITLVSNYKGSMECIDVIPHMDNDTKPTDDIYKDAIRRDFTINTLYAKIIFDVVTGMITITIIDPLGTGIQDLVGYTLRTPLNPSTTFKMDPRRLSRIPKMVEKMLRLFGFCNLAANLIEFINNSVDLKEVIELLHEQYPNREPLHLDILNVIKSKHFEQVLRTIMCYTDMFKLFCGIDSGIDIESVPIDEMMLIHNKLLNEGICNYESSILVTVITAYKLTTNVHSHVFTLPEKKNCPQYLLHQNNCTLFQYVRMWLPSIEDAKLVKIKVLNMIGQYEIGTDLWYHSISQFLLFSHGPTTFNTIKSANEAYKCIHKLVKIKHHFAKHDLTFVEELKVCGEIHEQYKIDIRNVDSENKKERIETIKNDALLKIKDRLQRNII